MSKRKYLTGLYIMQSNRYMGWMNWYISHGRLSLPCNIDAVSRKELRAISWRKVI